MKLQEVFMDISENSFNLFLLAVGWIGFISMIAINVILYAYAESERLKRKQIEYQLHNSDLCSFCFYYPKNVVNCPNGSMCPYHEKEEST